MRTSILQRAARADNETWGSPGIPLLIAVALAAYVAMILQSAAAGFWPDTIISSVGLLLLSVPFALMRMRHLEASGLVLVLSTLAVLTAFCAVGQGPYDVAIMAIPVTFVFAAIALKRVYLLLTLVLSVAAFGVLVFGNRLGWIQVTYPPVRPNLTTFLFGAMILIVFASSAYLMLRNMRTGMEVAQQEIERRRRSEEALSRSEAMYRDTFDSAPIGIFRSTEDGKFLIANSSLALMLGFASPEDLISTVNSTDIGRALYVDPERYARLVEEGKATTGLFVFENDYRRKDGSVMAARLTTRIVKKSDGTVDHIQGMVEDITERREAEDSLRSSEAKFRAVVENSNDGILFCDPSAVISYRSPSCARINGFTDDGRVGKSGFETIHPDDVDSVRQSWERMARSPGMAIVAEYRIRHKDGTWRWVETTAQNHVENPDIGQIVVTSHDVTERREVEQKLMMAAQEWRNTFDSIMDPISIVGADCKLQRVNRAFADMVGKTPKELIGKTCHEVVHKSNCPVEDCPHQMTLRTGKQAAGEIFEPALDRYFHVSTSPILDGNGVVLASVHIARDVTEQRKMSEQLMITDRLASIGELVAGVAHELNNPLTGVIGFSQLLMEKDTNDETKEDLTVIVNEAQRAARIVRNLLTFARKHSSVMQATQVNNVLADVLSLRAYEQRVNNIEVVRQFDSALPEIMADYFQLQQVFLNIMINAEFFMAETNHRGTLTIATERIDGGVRISISDDGPGIPAEHLGKIFNPFFTTKEVGKGTGLGLSICHGIIKEHSGTIYARSEPGKGATFVIEMPLDQPDRTANVLADSAVGSAEVDGTEGQPY